MNVLAIDPGPTESAFLEYDTDQGRPIVWLKAPNHEVLSHARVYRADKLAVEMIASYGMAVGAEVFETCVWIGRFVQAWWEGHDGPAAGVRMVYRSEVKMHLCQTNRAKDSNVRQAIIDLYGGKDQAIGKKASQGPLYGLSGDCWAALGVAITASETNEREPS